MSWLFQMADKRAKEFNITGVTLKLTQGVVKNIIPAIASTNALISALVANEAFKFVTEVADNLDNFFMNNGTVGNYSLTVSHERNDDCIVCHTTTFRVPLPLSTTVGDFVEHLKDNEKLCVFPFPLFPFLFPFPTHFHSQLANPSFSRNGGAPIYFANRTSDQEKLLTPLQDWISSGEEILVTDTTYPGPVLLQIVFESLDE